MRAVRVLLRSPHCRDEFYDVYRPLLAGWHPAGMELQGVNWADIQRLYSPGEIPGVFERRPGGENGEGAVVCVAKGPSAGQTAAFIAIDLVLGVEHGAPLFRF